MKNIKFISFIILIAFSFQSKAQYQVHTEDIFHFWEAYDSVQTTTDKAQQTAIIQKLYVDRGSEGLKEFMILRGGTAEKWQEMMANEKDKLVRIRPFTLSVLKQKAILDEKLAYFKQIYPNFKQGDVFFTMGIGNSGGTTQGSHVLIGCEVAANEKPDWAIALVLHEFVHTQQKMEKGYHVLGQSILEGMADFVSELVNGQKLAEVNPNGHTGFGLRNNKAVWERFKEVMFSNDENYFGWLYGSPGVTIESINKVDMGYFIGYQICKSYYDKATDKSKALKEIIELDLNKNEDEAARQFLLASGYVPKKDINFVKNTPFGHIEIKAKPIQKVLYGYKLTADKVIFEYSVPKVLDMNTIKTVSVAGSFNGWNPKDVPSLMKKTGKRTFTLEMPRTAFDKTKTYTFKFVLNGDNWMNAPDTALNVEENGYGNLVLEVK